MSKSRARPAPAPAVDIVIESPLWAAEPDAETIVRRAIAQAAAESAPKRSGAVSVLLTGDAAIRKLNREWRGLDKPTNVLSFPAARSPAHDGTAPLGDIAIAHETLAREAKAEGKRFSDHLAHLAVHGFLHLLGYDHESEGDAEAMEQLERVILARLGVPDPYLAHQSEA